MGGRGAISESSKTPQQKLNEHIKRVKIQKNRISQAKRVVTKLESRLMMKKLQDWQGDNWQVKRKIEYAKEKLKKEEDKLKRMTKAWNGYEGK